MGVNVSGLENLKIGGASAWSLGSNGNGRRNLIPSSFTVKLGSVLVDVSFVAIAWTLTFAGRFLLHPDVARLYSITRHHALVLVIYAAILVLSCYANGLYKEAGWRPLLDEIIPIIRAQVLATVLLSSIVYLSGASDISRLIVAATAVINIATFTTWRMLWRKLVARRLEQGYGVHNMLIMGAGEVGRAMAHYFCANRHYGYRFKGFLDAAADDPEVLGVPQDFTEIARSHFVDVLFITSPSDRELVKTVALEARELNVSVKIVPDFYDGLAWNSPIEHVGGFPVQVVHRPPIPRLALMIKRAVDVVASVVGILLLSPLFLIIAVAIRLDSPGPILYRSVRVGKKGRKFVCYKFRTMVANAEALKQQLQHLNERAGVLFKIREDPRITRVGRALRKYSLDEFPQLLNVLKGEMSLVGPRPPVPSEVEMYSLDHLRRLDVTPGLTGLWQIMARQDPSFDTYVALDIEYIETWSPLLDLKLLLKTVPTVLRGTGH